MTLSPERQQENEVNLQCSAKILDLKEFANLKIIDIADILGVRYETISRASLAKTGSPQLLAGLELLLQNLQMKKQLAAIQTAQQTMQSLVTPTNYLAMNAAISSGENVKVLSKQIVSAAADDVAIGAGTAKRPPAPRSNRPIHHPRREKKPGAKSST
jgi:hypothetical protein